MSTILPSLRAGTPADLSRYVAGQLDHLLPNGSLSDDLTALREVMDGTLARMHPILSVVRNFEPNRFDHFNSLQYSTFLYILANEYWRVGGERTLADRLFFLNRALNAIDLFYSVQMPEIFFISHGLSAVLGNAVYDNHLVFFQSVTVGRLGDARPQLGRNVILYPGATVTGRSVIGDNCVVSAGTVIHNCDIPDDTIVSQRGGDLIFKRRTRNFMELYFRK